MVGLSWTVGIDRLEVDHPTGTSVTLRGDEHPGTPGDRGFDRHPLEDTQADILVQPCLDLGSPVDRDSCWCMDGDRFSFLVHEEAERGTVIHEGEGLMLAPVEGAGGVPVQDVLLQQGEVLLGGRTGQCWRCRWWRLSEGT